MTRSPACTLLFELRIAGCARFDDDQVGLTLHSYTCMITPSLCLSRSDPATPHHAARSDLARPQLEGQNSAFVELILLVQYSTGLSPAGTFKGRCRGLRIRQLHSMMACIHCKLTRLGDLNQALDSSVGGLFSSLSEIRAMAKTCRGIVLLRVLVSFASVKHWLTQRQGHTLVCVLTNYIRI